MDVEWHRELKEMSCVMNDNYIGWEALLLSAEITSSCLVVVGNGALLWEDAGADFTVQSSL